MQRYSKFFPKNAKSSWKSEMISTASSKAFKDKVADQTSQSMPDFQLTREQMDTALKQPWLEKLRLMAHKTPIIDKSVVMLGGTPETVKFQKQLSMNLSARFSKEVNQQYDSNNEIPSPIPVQQSYLDPELVNERLGSFFVDKQRSYSDVKCEWITLKSQAGVTGTIAWADEPQPGGKVVMYIHGGGFALGHPRWAVYQELALNQLQQQDGHTPVAVLSVDYGLAPQVAFPGAQLDCQQVYEIQLQKGIEPEDIIIAGDSAGGNQALTTTQAAIQVEQKPPTAMMLFSPFTDLTLQHATVTEEIGDPLQCSHTISAAINLYAGFYKQNSDQTPLQAKTMVNGLFQTPVYSHVHQEPFEQAQLEMVHDVCMEIMGDNTTSLQFSNEEVKTLAMTFLSNNIKELNTEERESVWGAYLNAIVTHWSASPIRAPRDLVNQLPTIQLTAGTREILLGDAVGVLEMALRSRQAYTNETKDLIQDINITTPDYLEDKYDAKVSVEPLHTEIELDKTKTSITAYFYPNMFHVFFQSPFLPETKHTLKLIKSFILDKVQWFK